MARLLKTEKPKKQPSKVTHTTAKFLNQKTVPEIAAMYLTLEKKYIKLLEGAFCHECGTHYPREGFYKSKKWTSGLVPICKKCLYEIATGYDEKTGETNETPETIQKALKIMDLPYINSLYMDCKARMELENEASNRQNNIVFPRIITMLQSLPQYDDWTWEDSDYEVLHPDNDGFEGKQKAKEKTKKMFGLGFKDEDYIFLQEQYNDWAQRCTVEDKPMEEIVKRICFKQLEIYKAQLAGRDTKELDKTLQELLGAANLKPVQKKKEQITDSYTFSQLIDRWEKEKPIPEPDEEFKDVDKIGLYIDVFFKGHLAKMLGLKNPLSHMYTKFMEKYTVHKPEYDADEHSEQLFEAIFGRKENEDKF